MFYTAADNTGVIRINYISDDTCAAAMNKLNRSKSSGSNQIPMVASPCLMGGYRYPIIEDIADGRLFQILKAHVNDAPQDLKMKVQEIAAAPETLFSYLDQGDFTAVQILDHNRKENPLSSYGWTIANSPKTFKRLKTLSRPFRIWDRLIAEDNTFVPLRVMIVDDADYLSDEIDADKYTPTEIERLLDGAVVIRRTLFTSALENIEFPVFKDSNPHEHPEFYVEAFRRQEFLRQAQYFHTFNGRIFGDMHLLGLDADDPLHTRPGLIKAEFFCDVAGLCDKYHVDVIAARSAFKTEVSYDGPPFILMEPQKAKRSGVNSDIQTMSNLPAIYTVPEMKSWVDDYLAAKFNMLKNNELLPEWFDMSSGTFNSGSRALMPSDVDTLNKWNARIWMLSGLKITDSPYLFEQLATAVARSINPRAAAGARRNPESRLRFPVPCAIRAQVISSSMSSMAGYDADVDPGGARWVEDLEAVVVHDEDWLEMYRSHGGMDLDDFFVCYYRTINGLPKIIAVRSPNDWGEYTIFDYVPGDWFPVFTKADGTFIQFPEASADPALWPERLSEVYSRGDVQYRGLPSETIDHSSVDTTYGIAAVMRLVENSKGSATCVGANVNARTLHSVSMRSHRPLQLCPMEGAIDAGTQGGSPEDVAAVQAEANEIVKTVIASDNKLCAYLWRTRFARFNNTVPAHRLDTNTHLYQADVIRKSASAEFMKMVRKYSQEHLVKLNPVIHKLGARYLRQALRVLVNTRRSMFDMQDVNAQSMGVNDWYVVHYLAIQTIEGFANPIDKYDFILALYSACFKLPTQSTGKISDQIVMNPHLFPYLLDALRYYGIANHVDIDETNQLISWKQNTWVLTCDECQEEKETDNPVLLQSYEATGRICKDCRVNEKEKEKV